MAVVIAAPAGWLMLKDYQKDASKPFQSSQ
jgi:hypothetical protein